MTHFMSSVTNFVTHFLSSFSLCCSLFVCFRCGGGRDSRPWFPVLVEPRGPFSAASENGFSRKRSTKQVFQILEMLPLLALSGGPNGKW